MCDIDMNSGAEAATLEVVEYALKDSSVALGKTGAERSEVERAAVGSAKAQVSTTCLPCVFMILMDWPLRRIVAAPRRAGMVWSCEDIIKGYKMLIENLELCVSK